MKNSSHNIYTSNTIFNNLKMPNDCIHIFGLNQICNDIEKNIRRNIDERNIFFIIENEDGVDIFNSLQYKKEKKEEQRKEQDKEQEKKQERERKNIDNHKNNEIISSYKLGLYLPLLEIKEDQWDIYKMSIPIIDGINFTIKIYISNKDTIQPINISNSKSKEVSEDTSDKIRFINWWNVFKKSNDWDKILSQLSIICQRFYLKKQESYKIYSREKILFLEDLYKNLKYYSNATNIVEKYLYFLSKHILVKKISFWDMIKDKKIIIDKYENNNQKINTTIINGGYPNHCEQISINDKIIIQYRSLSSNKNESCKKEINDVKVEDKRLEYIKTNYDTSISIPVLDDKDDTLALCTIVIDGFVDNDCLEFLNHTTSWVYQCINILTSYAKLEEFINNKNLELHKAYESVTSELDKKREAEKLQRCLFDIASLCSSLNINNWKDFYPKVNSIISSVLNMDCLCILILDKSEKKYKISFSSNNKNQDINNYIQNLLNNLNNNFKISSPNILKCNDLSLSKNGRQGEKKDSYFNCALISPLTDESDTFGLISIFCKDKNKVYSKKDLDTLSFVAQQISHTIIRNESLIKLHEAYSSLEQKIIERTKDLKEEISKRKKIERQLKFENLHDALTKLPNRKYLNIHLSSILENNKPCAVLFMDLDKFKSINDTFGHNIGDEVLKEFARRLKDNFRPNDFVCRLSGDEFVVVMDFEINKDTVNSLSNRVIHAMKEEFLLSSATIKISCSVGCFIYDPSSLTNKDTKITNDLVLKKADIALYQAKNSGRQCVASFTKEDEISFRRRQILEEDVNFILDKGQLNLSFIPLMDNKNNSIKAYEIELHWSHPSFGDIKEEELYDILKVKNLVQKIDTYVLSRSIQIASNSFFANQDLIFNLHPIHLENTSFYQNLTQSISQNNFKANRLCFQIDDNTLSSNNADIKSYLDRLNSLNMCFSIKFSAKNNLSFSALIENNIRYIFLDENLTDFNQYKDSNTKKRAKYALFSIFDTSKKLDFSIVSPKILKNINEKCQIRDFNYLIKDKNTSKSFKI